MFYNKFRKRFFKDNTLVNQDFIKDGKQSVKNYVSSYHQDLKVIEFKRDEQDTRIKHIFLNDKGKRIFNEIFELQKKRIYNALLNSNSEEVLNFDSVLKKIING